jgi:hypothetical protein
MLSSDELTGVQALERKHPGLPLAPGKVGRQESEYKRHAKPFKWTCQGKALVA